MELQSLAWGVPLVSRLGYTTPTLISDREAAIARLPRVRAKSMPSAELKVSRRLVRTLMLSGLVVRVFWPSIFQPADPLPRLEGGFVGDKMRAERMTWLIYKQLLRDTSVVEF